MTLALQYGLASNTAFQQRAQAAAVHAAIAVTTETLNEVQTVHLSGGSGTFTLTFNGQTTAAIAVNATAAAVQTALQALSSVGTGNVVCTGGPLAGTDVVVTFVGALGSTAQPLMSATNPTSGTTTITRTTAGQGFVNHAARAVLAKAVLNGTGPSLLQIALALADNATVQGDFDPTTLLPAAGATEAAITNDMQFQMASVFNSFA